MLEEAARYEQAERRFDYRTGSGMGGLLKVAFSRGAEDRLQAPGLPGVRGTGLFRYEHAFGLLYAMLPRQLHSADRNAMAFGVESRFPFLDHDLVDWCLKLPDQALIHAGWQKYILRKAFDGRLPAEVSWRVDKVGYAAPQDEWLRGPLRAWAEARVFSRNMQELPGFDKDGLRRAWDAHQSRSANCEGLLWRWLSLEQFHRSFFRDARHMPAPADTREAAR
jgi:asparagine synthase (glutamine-hydrolysing)